MDNTNYVALSRQMALWKQMNIVSNNMANMNTAGYKQDDVVFASYLQQTPQAQGIGAEPIYFTWDFGDYADFTEGSFKETGNPLDAAIRGKGFFCVETASGEMYTRKGQFTLNEDGALTTTEGNIILSEGNTPIFLAPDEREVVISESGDVITENGVIGRLKIAQFADEGKLLKMAGVLFENPAGNAVRFSSDNVRIEQGMVESSNVNAIAEMTNLIKIQRSYDYVQQMIDEEHTRLSNTISTFADLA
ncbi:MAG: flagellar basal-body rod protein FlgF [Alphaproteobacteria bacterium]|nr:flagellar basal-body rod protein FlgF [Alphaproteobacteria bacterium]